MQVSPPGSKRTSRRLSALFQLRERDSVPLLNQKLLEHQDELRRTQIECDDKVETAAEEVRKFFAWDDECTETDSNFRPLPQPQERKRVEADGERSEAVMNKMQEEPAWVEMVCKANPQEKETAESIKSAQPLGTTRKKTWRIRLVDRKPSLACVNDEPVEQHRLADDEIVSRGRNSLVSLLEQRTEMPPPDAEEHECTWKNRLLERDSRRLGIRGVTVLFHLEEREDVIFQAIDWKGGEPRVKD
ncbi:hypothetical protein N431DRAFT_364519 [Stipitochalara longipes BDJ]|nr:hypothetical protein N431DRAFT_364519 [Stipitochalara longipes BDJ]